MKKCISSLAALALVSTFMVGCSSDDGATAKEYNGVFVDAAVSGITWTCGTRTGVTDAAGRFGACFAGEATTFTLGTITLGSLTPAQTAAFADSATGPVITPKTLAEASGDPEIASKVAVTLLSLDADGDPSNGIQITADVVSIVETQYSNGLDLTDPEITTANIETEITAVVNTAAASHPGMQVVTKADADQHLAETEALIENGEITGPENPSPTTGAAS